MVNEKYNSKFKKMEIVPVDWEVKKLGNIADITKLAGFEYSKYFNSYKDAGEIIVIRGTNITHNKLDLSDIKTITRKTSTFLQRSKLNKDDLVFAYVGTIGPVYLIKESNKYHLGPNTSKITLNKSVSNKFIFSYFNSWLIKNEIIEHTSIGAQPSLSMSKIRNFKIILPPLPEQKAIAEVLSDTDNLIQALEKRIAKKRLIKQGAMQKLLTPKDDWEVKKLGEVFNISAGGDLIKDAYSLIKDEKHPYPIYSNALTNKGLYGFTKIYRHEENCITVTARGMVGAANERNHKFDAIGRVLILRPISAISCFFMSEFINHKIEFSIESTGVPQLTAPQISKYEIKFPNKKEQIRIATILSDMNSEIETLEKKLAKYKQLKQGLMQELLTGKTRLIVNYK